MNCYLYLTSLMFILLHNANITCGFTEHIRWLCGECRVRVRVTLTLTGYPHPDWQRSTFVALTVHA